MGTASEFELEDFQSVTDFLVRIRRLSPDLPSPIYLRYSASMTDRIPPRVVNSPVTLA